MNDITGKILRFFNLPDNTKERQWTKTSVYKARIEQLKYLWIISGIIILIFFSLPLTVFVLLISLFVSIQFLEP